jgi:hypothetical protein
MIRNQLKIVIKAVFVILVTIQFIAAGPARADRDVYLANVGGQVAVGSAADTSPAEPDLDTRVFARVMVPGFPPINPPDYGLDEPGFFSLPAGDAEIPAGAVTLPANASITVNLSPFAVNSQTAALYYWNGSGAVDFQPVSQAGVTLTIDPNPIGGTGASGGADIHPSYRLDNGAGGVPADGVYLTAPIVSVTGLANSDRFYFLHLADALVTDEDDAEVLGEGLDAGQAMFKGKDFAFFNSAVAYVESNLAVPEPCGACLAFFALAAFGLTLRGRSA